MDKLQVSILSFACCNPALAKYDEQYKERLNEATEVIEVETVTEVITVTAAALSPRYLYMREVLPLFQKYGSAIFPALFLNKKLVLYGEVPPVEKLVTVLKRRIGNS